MRRAPRGRRSAGLALLIVVALAAVALAVVAEHPPFLRDVVQLARQVRGHFRSPPPVLAAAPADRLLIGPDSNAKPLRYRTVAVYRAGHLAPGWQDWSWTTHSLFAAHVPGSTTPVLWVAYRPWSGIYLHSLTPLDVQEGTLTLTLNGGTRGGQRLAAVLVNNKGAFGVHLPLDAFLPHGVVPARRWVTVQVALRRLLAPGSAVSGVVIQEFAGKSQPPLFIGALTLRVAGIGDYPVGHTSVVADVTTLADRHAISPYIYGLASDDGDAYLRTLRPTLIRWGGNPSTRYNWQIGHAWNNARDALYTNVDFGNARDSVSDQSIRRNSRFGAAILLTIPTIGWVAKDTTSFSFPGPNGQPTDGAGSSCTDPRVATDPSRTSISVGPSFMQAWVHHLQQAHLRVGFFAMDNEPDSWGFTHYDVHPTCTGYDEIYHEFVTYASAVKAVVPRSLVTGPVSCCWWAYWGSMQGTADRLSHGNMPFLPWFLQSVARYDRAHGVRTLDVLDIHYYPDGLFNDDTSALTAAWRLLETRSLWDPTYSDHSWIGTPISLIPRMHSVIQSYYPGTRLGITEWNWGAEGTMNGALAVADVLGIFGQQNLYLAAYYAHPPAGSPAAHAFQLLRNYDGEGASFGDISVRATSSNRDRLAVYASLRTRDHHLVVLCINKMPTTAALTTLSLHHFLPASLHTYRYSAVHLDGIIRLPAPSTSGIVLHLSLPPYSLTLLDMAPRGGTA